MQCRKDANSLESWMTGASAIADRRGASLYVSSGGRKYLNGEERAKLLAIACERGDAEGLFCRLLLETGCRLSEGLALRAGSIDLAQRTILFECLKKRRRGIFRAVPVSDDLVAALGGQFGLASPAIAFDDPDRLWPWSRTTGWRRVSVILAEAGISGTQACPKGFRHGFGVAAVSVGIPLNLVQRWLGHADMKTTAIYADASGPEERSIASRLWLTHTAVSGGARHKTAGRAARSARHAAPVGGGSAFAN